MTIHRMFRCVEIGAHRTRRLRLARRRACLLLTVPVWLFAITVSHSPSASAQTGNAAFDRVRQLPDLGACTSAADPDLRRALATAVKQAQAEAQKLLDLAQDAKDTGLIPADKLRSVSESAQKIKDSLSAADDCVAARAFAKLSAVNSTTTVPVVISSDGTCEHSSPPCVNQPRETDTSVTGRLSFAGGTTLPPGTTAFLKVGNDEFPINIKDAATYKPETGAFTLSVAPLNAYNTLELVQKDAAGAPLPNTSLPVHVLESIACDKSSGRRPCVNTPYAGDAKVSGEVAVKDNTLDPNTRITVKVNGVPAGEQVPATQVNGKFIFEKSGLDPLARNSTVQADQTPSVTGSSNSSGPVPVQSVQSQDKITVSPDTLDFGHQAMQTASAAKQVTVTNNTGGPLQVELLTTLVKPRDFQVSGCQDSVESSHNCTFSVVFAPFPSNNLKLRERFIAVVPVAASTQFEALREDLNAKEQAAARAEDLWRRDLRCTDNNYRGDDCKGDFQRDICRQKTQDATENCGAEPGAGDATHDKQKDRCLARVQWSCYEYERDEAARVEENLRTKFHVVTLRAVADHWKFPFTRAVVGADMSAATSRTIKQGYFVDLDLLAPLKWPFTGKTNQDPLENRLSVWLNPRITSLPQATSFSAVSTINETGSFFDPVKSGNLDKIVNGFDTNGGLDIALIKPRDGIPWWGEYVNTQARLAPSLIIGAGASTPFSTDNTDVRSSVTQAICDAFAAPTNQAFSVGVPQSPKSAQQQGLVCTYTDPNSSTNPQKTPLIAVNPANDPNKGVRSFIDFYQQDRSRFFRRYYAGLRLKTYFFSQDVHSNCRPFEPRRLEEGDCSAPYDIFPAIIDITIGQDEAVTAGRFWGAVLRLEGVYPLPWYPGVHVFGSMFTRLGGKNGHTQPFSGYTIQDQNVANATDQNTFRFALQPLDRDYFRVGIGVDLIQVFKKTGQPNKNSPQAPANDQAKSGS